MSTLPEALAPWRAQLDLFPADLASALAPLLPRVALALGPLRVSAPTGDGDPDGFAGLSRRGNYERLLLSEWLLADELPDEFLRRAAAREHAFLELARRSPARCASSVALFDAGPASLGAPRVAHLAALIVLAARAAQAGASFTWGLLQAPGAPLVPGASRESLLGLLGARTAVAPTAGDVTQHAERAAREHWDDAWIVGAASEIPGWRHGVITVADVLDPDRRALSFTVRTPRASPREVELTLPPARTCAQLLRDPFAPATLPPPPTEQAELFVRSNLVFAANGTKVFARGPTGEILSYPVPRNAAEGKGRPKRYRPRQSDGVVAAVGWVDRGLAMLVIESYRLVLEHTRHAAHLDRSVGFDKELTIHAPDLDDPLTELIASRADDEGFFFTDARASLFHVLGGRHGAPDRVAVVAGEVSAVSSSQGRCTFVGRGLPGAGAGAFHLGVRGARVAGESDQILAGDGSFEACFGLTFPAGHALSIAAVQQQGDRWTAHRGRLADADLFAPPGCRVIAPLGPDDRVEPGLIVLEPDGRTLAFIGRHVRIAYARADSPVLDARLSPARAQLAYATAAGEVVIHAIGAEAPLARYRPEDVR